ncbi:hypothetical protein ROZALSC1DRAFT_26106 [Rozella allomycis CSF55]|uniref:Uncharacterized protein n=1 Tax=Rozella allomycis (strain CSF55) TaxID=988480 RepID=A0A4P9YC61_ROZAC|nr:hypothetical protein ROZALSC1DRAFT_26106 [Rozella allomycis CSF55]
MPCSVLNSSMKANVMLLNIDIMIFNQKDIETLAEVLVEVCFSGNEVCFSGKEANEAKIQVKVNEVLAHINEVRRIIAKKEEEEENSESIMNDTICNTKSGVAMVVSGCHE